MPQTANAGVYFLHEISVMKRLMLMILLGAPMEAAAQGVEPALELGAGITQSRNRSGDALHGQVSAAVLRFGDMQLRGELFHQEGTNGGAGKCERLGAQYCIGTSDRNRLTGLSATLHVPLGDRGRLSAYVPLGVGLYHRRTRTTETEGPIAICTDNGVLAPCPGNPPLRSVTYDDDATLAGYNVGVGLLARVSKAKVFVEMRAHDLLESDSRAGAVAFSVGVRF